MTSRDDIRRRILADARASNVQGLLDFYAERPSYARNRLADRLWIKECRRYEAQCSKMRREIRALKRRVRGDA